MKMDRIVPMLPVRDMPASVAFYKKLGFCVESENAQWGWAMLKFDECRLMIDQSINGHAQGPRGSVVYLYPDDVAAFHLGAKRNGVTVPDLADTFYDMREFRLDDPDGNRLWIGQPREH